MILLDACTLLWLAVASDRLSPAARKGIAAAGEFVYVSAISAWEIAWILGFGSQGQRTGSQWRHAWERLNSSHCRRPIQILIWRIAAGNDGHKSEIRKHRLFCSPSRATFGTLNP